MNKNLKKYIWVIFYTLVIIIIGFFNPKDSIKITYDVLRGLKVVGQILVPTFIIVALTDVWIPKETIQKGIGKTLNVKGYLIMTLLAIVGAGPLYVAFPIAVLLFKKGVRIGYIVYFIGGWTVINLINIIYEINYFSVKFMLFHMLSVMFIYLIYSIIIDKVVYKHHHKTIDLALREGELNEKA